MVERAGFSLPSERLETRFTDATPPLSSSEAILEGSRCLYCHDAPCTAACPTSIDVAAFIRKITTGNLRGAARTILTANLLGASCARVCPVEVLCEGACVHVTWGHKPIEIGRLQRHAIDTAGSSDLLPRAAKTTRSIGLVGSGPASLACAGWLALRGHAAMIYEKSILPGGLNTTGIAPYKLDLLSALEDVDFIRSLGVKIETGFEVGANLSAETLLDRHEYLFLGPGLGEDMRLGIPGEEGDGVVGAVEWIAQMKTDSEFSVDAIRHALVIGGGNTAVDAARELAGLGIADVRIIYRRTVREMKAYEHELAHARQEGVVVLECTAISEILRENGTIRAIRSVETESGRPTNRSRGVLPADLVVLAIGQTKPRALASLFPGVTCDERGCILADPQTGITGNPRIFAGGDAVNGGKEVVNAVHEGQVAARSIDRLLRAASDHTDNPGG